MLANRAGRPLRGPSHCRRQRSLKKGHGFLRGHKLTESRGFALSPVSNLPRPGAAGRCHPKFGFIVKERLASRLRHVALVIGEQDLANLPDKAPIRDLVAIPIAPRRKLRSRNRVRNPCRFRDPGDRPTITTSTLLNCPTLPNAHSNLCLLAFRRFSLMHVARRSMRAASRAIGPLRSSLPTS